MKKELRSAVSETVSQDHLHHKGKTVRYLKYLKHTYVQPYADLYSSAFLDTVGDTWKLVIVNRVK